MEEIEDYMRISYRSKWESVIDHLIRFSRHLQKEFIEGDGKLSGEMFLREMVIKGDFSMENFMAIHPAVTHYDKPYELNINQPTD